jgi:hypothetical protein
MLLKNINTNVVYISKTNEYFLIETASFSILTTKKKLSKINFWHLLVTKIAFRLYTHNITNKKLKATILVIEVEGIVNKDQKVCWKLQHWKIKAKQLWNTSMENCSKGSDKKYCDILFVRTWTGYK